MQQETEKKLATQRKHKFSSKTLSLWTCPTDCDANEGTWPEPETEPLALCLLLLIFGEQTH